MSTTSTAFRNGAFLLVAVSFGLAWPAICESSDANPDTAGYKGDRLKGSISCIDPNIISDLIERISEEINYSFVARVYMEQGYCVEADVPTVLVRPLSNRTYRTWEGYWAETWETSLEWENWDGTRAWVKAYSIVFPREMEATFSH